MPPNESSRLLENGNNVEQSPSYAHRFTHFLKGGDDEPSWLQSYKFFFFGSWFNLFLVFVPLSFISHLLNLDAVVRFSFSFIAIIPLAKLLGTATEQLSLELGQTLSGLLNASFGNAVEIIVGIVALLQGELEIVQTSLLGSILSNLLLVLGCSFVAGGISKHENKFQQTGAQNSSSLMTLACLTMVIPAAYYTSKVVDSGHHKTNTPNGLSVMNKSFPYLSDLEERYADGILIISRGTAIVLLVVYAIYINFQLRSHKDLFQEEDHDADQRIPEHNNETVEEKSEMSVVAAGSSLVLSTLVTSFCADYLVASIQETAERYNIPKAFIGLILLPLANAAEHVTSIWMAMKDKMELSIGICVGSSIQISAFVVPLLVIIGWATHHDLTLVFANFETVVLFASVMLVNLLIQDGKSNYMEGVMLVALYLVIGLAFWVS